MKNYSVREMQREYRGVLRVTAWAFSAVLLAASLAGAILLSRGAGREDVVTAALLLGVGCLGAVGWFLVLTDRRRLMEKTPFGLDAAALGNGEETLHRIDESAEKLFDDRGAFILTRDYLLIRYLSPCRLDPRRECVRPIPAGAVLAVTAGPDGNSADPDRIRAAVVIDGGRTQEFICYQRRDLDDLAAWIRRAKIEK